MIQLKYLGSHEENHLWEWVQWLSAMTEQTLIIVNALQVLAWDISLLPFRVLSWMLSFCQFKDT